VKSGEEGFYKIFRPDGGSTTAIDTYGGEHMGFSSDNGEVGGSEPDRLFKLKPINIVPQITIQNLNFLNKDFNSLASQAE